MATWKIHQGDVVEWCKNYQGPKFHALFGDAPYHLQSIQKRFGGENSAPSQVGTDGAFARAAAGFMGKTWDGGDVAFRPETWAAMRSVMLPGAFGIAFAGSRGWHRMGVAIEDAGFIFHPTIFILYAFGSGFPKATNISKAIDKHGGESLGWFGPYLRKYREEKGITQKELAKHFPSKTGGMTGCVANWELGLNTPTVEQYNILVDVLKLPFKSLEEAERKVIGTVEDNGNRNVPIISNSNGSYDVTLSSTELASTWEGHRYGLQALKPAVEPCLVFQNPYDGRPLDNITQTGAGALNIDAGRIRADPLDDSNRIRSGGWNSEESGNHFTVDFGPHLSNVSNLGRWPSNLILEHAPGCKIIGYEDDPGYVINRWEDDAHPFGGGAGNDYQSHEIKAGKVPVYECEEGCPVLAMNRQTGVNKNGSILPEYHKRGTSPIGTFTIRDRTGEESPSYGDEGFASRYFYQADSRLDECDPFFYTVKAGRMERNAGAGRNPHPTVKALSLTSYLAGLLIPPPEYSPRRLLVPFSGVGSEMIGGVLAGWDHVEGVELTDEYIPVAEKRLAWWNQEMDRLHTHNPKDILEAHGKNRPQPSSKVEKGPKQLSFDDLTE